MDQLVQVVGALLILVAFAAAQLETVWAAVSLWGLRASLQRA
jgi:hypothetical protein